LFRILGYSTLQCNLQLLPIPVPNTPSYPSLDISHEDTIGRHSDKIDFLLVYYISVGFPSPFEAKLKFILTDSEVSVGPLYIAIVFNVIVEIKVNTYIVFMCVARQLV